MISGEVGSFFTGIFKECASQIFGKSRKKKKGKGGGRSLTVHYHFYREKKDKKKGDWL